MGGAVGGCFGIFEKGVDGLLGCMNAGSAGYGVRGFMGFPGSCDFQETGDHLRKIRNPASVRQQKISFFLLQAHKISSAKKRGLVWSGQSFGFKSFEQIG
jgi:hypothetical protein